MTEWQPIETAPRDEGELLLYNGYFHIGGWSEWYEYWVDRTSEEIKNVTFWAELPEPPITLKKKHRCKGYNMFCSSTEEGLLVSVDYEINNQIYRSFHKVNYCPICGEKTND